MKKILLIIFTIALTTIQLVGQSDCTQTGSTNCENNTHTDPNPTYTSPMSNDFKQNTFDWTQPTFPIHKPDYTNYFPHPTATHPLQNPYYRTVAYLQYIAGGADSDFDPKNGWELIKQDFGYIYGGNNVWNGVEKPTQGIDQIPIAYFILYNKYSSILRILATTPTQNGTTDKVQVNIELINPNNEFWETFSNYNDYKACGIFINTSPIATALDKETEIPIASSIAFYPGSKGDFFYADFQLSYDPCVCLFKSGLNITFNTISVAQIKLNAKILGVNTDIANITNSSGSIFGDGEAGEDFYTQFFTEGNNDSVKSIMQHYQDIESLINRIKAQNGGSAPLINDMKNLLKYAGIVAKTGSAAPLGVAGVINPKILAFKAGIEFISQWVDFISVMDGKDKKAVPSVIAAQMEAIGVSKTDVTLHGFDFRIAVPGSCGADNSPEYSVADVNGVLPMYPMYNETVGLFALLKTPEIERSDKHDDFINLGNITTCTPSSSSLVHPSKVQAIVTNRRFTYKLKNNQFQFAFNPIVNAQKTTIEAAIEVYGIKETFKCTSTNEVTNLMTPINCDLIDSHNGENRFRTDFFPIECLSEVVFQAGGHSFDGDQGRYTAKINQVISKAFIILNIYYVFKVDEYGEEHFTVQTLKYPLEIVNTGFDLEQEPNFSLLANVPNNLVIPATVYTQGTTIYSRGRITITGDQDNQSSPLGPPPLVYPQVVIIAEEGIDIVSGSIGPNVILKTGHISEFICTASPLNPMTTEMLNDFCGSNQYKARDFSLSASVIRRSIDNTTDKLYILPNPFTLFPNPNTGAFNIKFERELNNSAQLTLYDITGRVLYSQTLDKGHTNFSIQTDNFADGIYFATITQGDYKKTEKVMIQRN